MAVPTKLPNEMQAVDIAVMSVVSCAKYNSCIHNSATATEVTPLWQDGNEKIIIVNAFVNFESCLSIIGFTVTLQVLNPQTCCQGSRCTIKAA